MAATKLILIADYADYTELLRARTSAGMTRSGESTTSKGIAKNGR
jgi:hypothetical protein